MNRNLIYDLILGTTLLLLSISNICNAYTIKSTRIGTAVEVSRIVELVKLIEKPDIQINVTVRDLGGATEVSPTQELFFTLYRKGEKFSADATFNLGPIYDFKSATKLPNGNYEIFVGGVDFETSMPKNKLLIINAQKAINEILKVKCEKYTCPESVQFKSIISINEQ